MVWCTDKSFNSNIEKGFWIYFIISTAINVAS